MSATDYSQIRQELEQMHHGTPKKSDRSPMFDFGLFILMYFFALVVVVTAMLAAGITLQRFACFYALPVAWLGLTLYRRAPLYTLTISLLGVLFLGVCAIFVSQYFDIAWDSNCYHKADTGMLVYGWNPFRQTMTSYANSTSFLPYNSEWLSYQVDNQPKASFIIGASFYALTGNIAYGKVFNIASMVACICIVAPLLRDAFRLSSFTAFVIALLTSANPITLGQALSYYNDGFVYQMLTVAAAAFAYMAFKPDGRFTRIARAAAFIAVCMAVNIKTSAALFCTVLCVFYYIARVIAIAQSDAEPKVRKRRQLHLFLYFFLMVLCAVCVVGAATYIINLVRYGNPFYGMLGSSSINTLLESLMSPKIHRLPLFAQFFVSLFSHTSNELFTDIILKIPFTFTASELHLVTLDANVSGWGIMFSGIFLVSLAVIIQSIRVLSKRRSRKVKFLVTILLIVFLPVFIIPYLFSARYYLQPFWLPATALICLFAPSTEEGAKTDSAKAGGRKWMKPLGAVLCLLLAFNCITAYNYISMQMNETKESKKTIDFILTETENGTKVMDFTPMSRGLFYGLVFNLQDEGVTKYNFTEHITGIQGNVLYYLAYNLRDAGDEAKADTNSFLYSLNSNGYLVIIAKQGACGPLDERMLALLDAMALRANEHDSAADNYLTVVDTNAHIRVEESGPQPLIEQLTADKLTVQVKSAADAASIVIEGTEYALARDGYNIVVYDPSNMALVDSVVINTDASPMLYR